MPTNFFLGGIARRMDMHSLMGARGNFGPWGIMDWIFGTTIRDSSSDGPSSDESDEPHDMRKAYEAAKRKAATSSSKGRGPGRR
jgi:hypothetical protein